MITYITYYIRYLLSTLTRLNFSPANIAAQLDTLNSPFLYATKRSWNKIQNRIVSEFISIVTFYIIFSTSYATLIKIPTIHTYFLTSIVTNQGKITIRCPTRLTVKTVCREDSSPLWHISDKEGLLRPLDPRNDSHSSRSIVGLSRNLYQSGTVAFTLFNRRETR